MKFSKLWLLPLLAVGAFVATPALAARGADCAVWGGTLMKWPATGKSVWEMCWVKPSQSVATDGSGLELRDIHYNGILVAKRLHAPILFAEYRNSGTATVTGRMPTRISWRARRSGTHWAFPSGLIRQLAVTFLRHQPQRMGLAHSTTCRRAVHSLPQTA